MLTILTLAPQRGSNKRQLSKQECAQPLTTNEAADLLHNQECLPPLQPEYDIKRCYMLIFNHIKQLLVQ